MSPSRASTVLVPLLVLVAGACAQASESGLPVNDLRFGVDFLLQPKVKERITLDDGRAGAYNWEQGGLFDTPGMRFEVAYVQGMSRRDRAVSGFIWELGLNYTSWDLNPSNFGNGPISDANGRLGDGLKYTQFGGLVGAGYATQPQYTGAGDLHFEFVPTLRGGVAQAQTVTPGAGPTVEDANAPWWEAGGKASLVLMDDQWILDLHLGFAYGESHPSISLPSKTVNGTAVSGGTSKMDVITSSPYAGLMVGWRF